MCACYRFSPIIVGNASARVFLQEKVPDESKERNSLWELQQTKISLYVEEVLAPHFCALINCVNECEPLIEQNHAQLLNRYTGERADKLAHFAMLSR